MPFYDYACTGCDNSFSTRRSCAERHTPELEPCSECGGEIKMIIGAPKIVSGVRGPQSAPDGFKDVLRHIKKQSGKGNTIDV
ncbi:FmdB-like transcriptional regulator [Salmonella phage SeF6a]|nr:FmdB-like transcriptional regulator [Salmonella phage SeF6a]